MRCLIPVHQENYANNSLKRATQLCDEITILYILDKKMIEKVQSEASYILPSYALDNVEEFIINIHRQEAEKIKKSIGKEGVEMRFVVGEYYESVERETLKTSPDLLMCDSYLRGLLNIATPIWIDRGGEIKECTLVINSLKRIKSITHSIEFARKICERLHASFYIHYAPSDSEGLAALKPLGKIVSEARGELLVFSRDATLKVPQQGCVLLL